MFRKSLGSASTGYFNFRCVKDTDGPDYASKVSSIFLIFERLRTLNCCKKNKELQKVFAGCTFGDKTVEPGESYVANGKVNCCSSSSEFNAKFSVENV